MRGAILVLVLVLSACGADEAERPEDQPSSTTTTEAPDTTVPAITLEALREKAYGTATCFDNPDCPVIEAVEVDNGTLLVTTKIFPDEDAEIPGLSTCVVATQLWEGPVRVLASDGSTLFAGQQGQTPICD